MPRDDTPQRRLRQLHDVSSERPTDGNILVWSAAEGAWIPNPGNFDDQYYPRDEADATFQPIGDYQPAGDYALLDHDHEGEYASPDHHHDDDYYTKAVIENNWTNTISEGFLNSNFMVTTTSSQLFTVPVFVTGRYSVRVYLRAEITGTNTLRAQCTIDGNDSPTDLMWHSYTVSEATDTHNPMLSYEWIAQVDEVLFGGTLIRIWVRKSFSAREVSISQNYSKIILSRISRE